MSRRVVVVGAGIAGLAAAHALSRDAPRGTEVLVLEGAARIGGKLHASPIAGRVVDEGAEAMLARAPEGLGLAREVGLADALTHPATTAASIVVAGVHHPVPRGTVMGVPRGVEELRGSGVLTGAALDRVAAEPTLAPRLLGLDEDVSVGDFVTGRLGAEVVERLVDPLLGGVYAGRAESLSLRATMPALAGALQTHGSLLEAARAAQPPSSSPPLSSPPSPAAPAPVFATLRGGLGSLPEAVAVVARAAGVEIRLNLPVREIARTERGFRLTAGPVPRPTYVEADAVIVAAPAQKAAGMLAAVAPAAATELRAIEYASVGIVTLAYRGGGTLPPGSGLLVPAGEGHAVKAVTFSGQKWAHLAGDDLVVLRGSVGRFGETDVLRRDDAELVDLVGRDVAELTGLRSVPVEARVTRWGGALPQYALGHISRVCRIRDAVAAVPGLAVCGAAYEGVGVPACIRTGRLAATQVLDHLTREAQSRYG